MSNMTKPLQRMSIVCDNGEDHEFFVRDLLELLPTIETACRRCKKPVLKGECCMFCGCDNSEE